MSDKGGPEGPSGLLDGAMVPYTGEATEATCDDTVDNDDDGLIDCADCEPAAFNPPELSPFEGFDNDGDGLVDCVDIDCPAVFIPLEDSPFKGIGDEVADRIATARLDEDDNYDKDGDCDDEGSPPDQGFQTEPECESFSQDCSPLPDGPNCQVDAVLDLKPGLCSEPDSACKPADDDETI